MYATKVDKHRTTNAILWPASDVFVRQQANNILVRHAIITAMPKQQRKALSPVLLVSSSLEKGVNASIILVFVEGIDALACAYRDEALKKVGLVAFRVQAKDAVKL